MKEIPTAEEFLRNHPLVKNKWEEECFPDIPKVMTEFVKLHVEEVLKQALNFEVDGCGCGESTIIKEHIKSILSSYIDLNIK